MTALLSLSPQINPLDHAQSKFGSMNITTIGESIIWRLIIDTTLEVGLSAKAPLALVTQAPIMICCYLLVAVEELEFTNNHHTSIDLL